MKLGLLISALILFGLPVIAENNAPTETLNFDFGYEGNVSAKKFYNRITMGFGFESMFLGAFGRVDYLDDGKWSHTESWMGDYYLNLQEALIDLHASDFSLKGGFMKAYERWIISPYAALLNGMDKLDRFAEYAHPSIGADFEYDGETVYYNSRWISVNWRSRYTYDYGLEGPPPPEGSPFGDHWQDKGVNFKTYGLKLGDLMIGYEESSVYLNRSFDPNYFFNPAPSILINTIWSQGDNPWVTRDNDASYMGFFGNYEGEDFYLESQFIIKDFNMSFLSTDIGYPNAVDKLAWSLGGFYDFDFGRLGFWHGGATKYMFEATYENADNPNPYPYEYTYYPIPVVSGRFIDYYDTYIGFPYGENALAFAFSYKSDFFIGEPVEFSLSAQLEYVIGGSKSPFNPVGVYHNHASVNPKLQLFYEDDVLEHTLSISATAVKRLSDFTFTLRIVLGYIWNKVGIYRNAEMTINNEPAIYKPVSGTGENISRLSLQVIYSFPLLK